MNVAEKRRLVFKKKKGLEKLYGAYGKMSIKSFYKKNNIYGKPSSSLLKKEFLLEFKKIVYKRLGEKKLAEEVIETISNEWSVGTAEHHGILTHPFFFSNALLSAQRNKKNIALFFTFANVSLDNSSFPRGVFFHDEEGNKKKYIFFPHSKRHLSVYTAQTQDAFFSYTGFPYKNLFPFIEKIFTEKDFYREVATVGTYTLGKLIDPKLKIIYIDIESIVLTLINKIHTKKKTDIYNLLFDKKFHAIFLKNFDGITGAFTTKNMTGTFLFWYIQEGCKQQLFYEEGYLVSKNGYRLLLNERNIRQALKKEELLPSMAFCFIVVSLHYKIVCGGGFSQIDYLDEIQNAWIHTLKEYKNKPFLYKKVQTKKFQGEFGTIVLQTPKGKVLASPFDWLIYGNKRTLPQFNKIILNTTVKEGLDAMMDEYYKITEGHYDTQKYEPHITPILNTKKM